jgi:xanthine dehydrogenase accessory factor
MRREDLLNLNRLRAVRRASIYLNDLTRGESRVIEEGQGAVGELAPLLEQAFRTGKSSLTEIEGRKLFLNVQLPPPRIVVIGAVHISQALATMAMEVGYDFQIVDPRTAFATEERFGGVDLIADWPEDVLKMQPLDAYSALVAVTHDPKIDDFPIEAALRQGCFYVGALGSRKTHAKRVERLLAAGLSEAEIGRIDAPVGLDIGAQSPAEIAVSIMGAIIQAFRRRTIVT